MPNKPLLEKTLSNTHEARVKRQQRMSRRYGSTTGEWRKPTLRESLIDTISDASKAANGFRIRLSWDQYNLVELKKIAENYCRAACDEIDREKMEIEANVQSWLLRIDQMTVEYGIDRATAIRWDMQAEGISEDDQDPVGYYCYKQGLGSAAVVEAELNNH